MSDYQWAEVMNKDGDLRAQFRDHLPAFHWQAIETGLLGRGIPDMEYCYRGAQGWVENKKTDAWAVDVRPEQVAWLLRRRRAGGRAFLAVRRYNVARQRVGAYDELWLLRGEYAIEVQEVGLRCDPRAIIGVWRGGPRAWSWAEVQAHLTAPVRAVSLATSAVAHGGV